MNASTDKDNYAQIGENLRFHVDMRFKQLTLLVAFLSLSGAGIISETSGNELIPGLTMKQVISFSGVLFTSVFLIMEVRSHLYWKKHHGMFPDLWPTPDHFLLKYISSTNSVLLLYLSTLIFWCYTTHILFGSKLTSALVLAIALLLSIYSIVNYWRIPKG